MVYPLSRIGSSKAIAVPDYFMATINDQQFRGNNLMPRFFAAVSSLSTCEFVVAEEKMHTSPAIEPAERGCDDAGSRCVPQTFTNSCQYYGKIDADVLQHKILRIHLRSKLRTRF